MGVRYLWPLLKPVCKEVKLYDLRNKILAIDLSIWLVKSLYLEREPYERQPYLKLIFYRCKRLLELNCTLIVFIDGSNKNNLKSKESDERMKKNRGNDISEESVKKHKHDLSEIIEEVFIFINF